MERGEVSGEMKWSQDFLNFPDYSQQRMNQG